MGPKVSSPITSFDYWVEHCLTIWCDWLTITVCQKMTVDSTDPYTTQDNFLSRNLFWERLPTADQTLVSCDTYQKCSLTNITTLTIKTNTWGIDFFHTLLYVARLRYLYSTFAVDSRSVDNDNRLAATCLLRLSVLFSLLRWTMPLIMKFKRGIYLFHFRNIFLVLLTSTQSDVPRDRCINLRIIFFYQWSNRVLAFTVQCEHNTTYGSNHVATE